MTDSRIDKKVRNARLNLIRAIDQGRDPCFIEARERQLQEALAEKRLGKVTQR